MFTGLIRHLGILESRSPRPGGARLRIAAPADLLARAEQGASIAVNGACLTSVAVDGRAWEAELSEETLEKTTLGRLPMGAALHLEPALRVGDPLDGHLVSGHVDGISLTVVDCGGDWFTVALIPETVKRTALDGLRPGGAVNLEADPIGRFVARALALRGSDEKLAKFAQGGWNG